MVIVNEKKPTELLASDFYYDLPESLIAQHPMEKRDHSRLMVINRESGEVEHKHFYDVIDYLREGDVLVINDSKVIPARLYGHLEGREEASLELLLLRQHNLDEWECLVKPGKRAKEGTIIEFSEELSCEVLSNTDFGGKVIRFIFDGVFENILDKLGSMPLPPYIKNAPKGIKEEYNTVYAKVDGSSAAPTAGLHFTPEMLEDIKNSGVNIGYVTLHVGLGTFRPVKVENIADHKMHSEHYRIDEVAC